MHQNPCNIAIVGVSALFPGSTDKSGFWRDILAGTDLIKDVPSTHWLVEDYYDPDPSAIDKTYCKRGAFLEDIDFNPMEFALPPSNLPSTDTSQLLALVVARQVLDDAARGQFKQMDRDRISVILGIASATELVSEMASRLQRPMWVKALRESGLPESEIDAICERITANYAPWQESTFPGLLGNVVAGRIANRLNLGGTNCVIDAACASSLSALSMSIMELTTGKSDMVITGGVDALNDIFMYMCFSKTPALSPTGDCRPFSDQADGTILGEGLGMVALKRLEDAERDGDPIYAVIKGLGSSSDGQSKSVYAPVSEGQAKALRRAYDAAGYSPGTVELIEAHGTGTKAGDVAEFGGLKLVFAEEEAAARNQWCAVGTVKSQIGHTKAAAGAAGLFKAVMALHHKVLPPTIKVSRPNPRLEIEKSPFYLNTAARPWIRDASHPRRASVSAFGFGGSNFHVALEEYTGAGVPADKVRSFPAELYLISVNTPEALIEACRVLGEQTFSGKRWLSAVRKSQEAYDPDMEVRLALVSEGGEDFRTKLNRAIEAVKGRGKESFSMDGIHYAHAAKPGGIAFLFPGQGSQYVNMGADLVMGFEQARSVWDRSASLLFEGTDTPLHRIVYPIPVYSEEERLAQTAVLTQTEWAQPALGAASLAVLSLLRSIGIKPDCVGGHSFGELSAMYAAGVIGEADLLLMARKRGDSMASAAIHPGSMSAVFSDKETVAQLIADQHVDVVIANYNSPKQLVVSGKTEEIERLESALNGRNIRFQRLSVASAFHSSVVGESVGPFRESLKAFAFSKPEIDVYSNRSGTLFSSDALVIRETIAEQIAEPVLFEQQLLAMYESGVRTFIEVGPGGVLTGLARQCLADRGITAVSTDRKGQNGVISLWNALGKLAVTGVAIDFAALWENEATYEIVPENEKKPGMIVKINGSNYKKPYPPAGGAAALPKPNPEKSAPQTQVEPVLSRQNRPERLNEPPLSEPAGLLANVPAKQNERTTGGILMTIKHPNPSGGSAQSADYGSLLHTFQELQRQTMEAHIAHQQAMASGHAAFLRSSEATFTNLTRLIAGEALSFGQTAAAQEAPVPVYEMPAQRAAIETPRYADASPAVYSSTPATREAVPAVTREAPFVTHMAAAPVLGQRPVAVPSPAAAPASVSPTLSQPETLLPAGPPADLSQLLFQIVAEKTGYPVEMLEPDMELESGLGIDSIKRVEILSSVQDQFPSAANLVPNEMAALQTLGEIADYLKRKAPGGTGSHSSGTVAVEPDKKTAVTETSTAETSTAASGSKEELMQSLLQIVADKTGYPVEMLEPSMELESGLGIDSIKRVEILSAIQDKLPDSIEVNANEMAALQTLGEIASYLEHHSKNV